MARRTRPEPDSATGLYAISVAADLAGMDPQSLRLYERRGLLEPARTDGGTRRYSADDLDRLQRIADLLEDGVNLAGIGKVFALEDDNERLVARNEQLAAENARLASENRQLNRASGSAATAANSRRRTASSSPSRRPRAAARERRTQPPG